MKKVRAEIVDAYCDLDSKIKALEIEKRRLRGVIDGYIDDLEPDQTTALKGDKATITVSACKINRVVDVSKVKKLLGNKVFMSVADVKLKKVEALLTGDEITNVVTEEYSSTRIYKCHS